MNFVTESVAMVDAAESATNFQAVQVLFVYRWDCNCVLVNTMSNSFLPTRNFESPINVRYFGCSQRCISI